MKQSNHNNEIFTNLEQNTNRIPTSPFGYAHPQNNSIRHKQLPLLIYIIIYISYIFLGALCFNLIERPNERLERLRLHASQLEFLRSHACVEGNHLQEFISQVIRASKMGISLTFIKNLTDYDEIKVPKNWFQNFFQKQNLKVNQKLEKIAHKDLQKEEHWNSNWNMDEVIFFCTTVITTIGYGTVTPATQGGKAFCILFACIGIPMNLVLISALATLCMPKIRKSRDSLVRHCFEKRLNKQETVEKLFYKSPFVKSDSDITANIFNPVPTTQAYTRSNEQDPVPLFQSTSESHHDNYNRPVKSPMKGENKSTIRTNNSDEEAKSVQDNESFVAVATIPTLSEVDSFIQFHDLSTTIFGLYKQDKEIQTDFLSFTDYSNQKDQLKPYDVDKYTASCSDNQITFSNLNKKHNPNKLTITKPSLPISLYQPNPTLSSISFVSLFSQSVLKTKNKPVQKLIPIEKMVTFEQINQPDKFKQKTNTTERNLKSIYEKQYERKQNVIRKKNEQKSNNINFNKNKTYSILKNFKNNMQSLFEKKTHNENYKSYPTRKYSHFRSSIASFAELTQTSCLALAHFVLTRSDLALTTGVRMSDFRYEPKHHTVFHIRIFHFVALFSIVILCTILIPALIFFHLEYGWTYLDAVYFCIISISTIGLGDLVPSTEMRYLEDRNLKSLWVKHAYRITTASYLLIGTTLVTLTLRSFHEIVDGDLSPCKCKKNDHLRLHHTLQSLSSDLLSSERPNSSSYRSVHNELQK